MENQTQYTAQQQFAPQQSPYLQQGQLEQPVSVKEWLLTFLILIIPVVNVIMLFVWAFGEGKPSKKNYFKAQLIVLAIVIVLYIILFLTIGAALLSIFSSEL